MYTFLWKLVRGDLRGLTEAVNNIWSLESSESYLLIYMHYLCWNCEQLYRICEGTEIICSRLISGSQSSVWKPLEVQDYFRDPPSQFYFINIFGLFTVLNFALMVDKTAGTSARIKTVALKCSSSHYILYCPALSNDTATYI